MRITFSLFHTATPDSCGFMLHEKKLELLKAQHRSRNLLIDSLHIYIYILHSCILDVSSKPHIFHRDILDKHLN